MASSISDEQIEKNVLTKRKMKGKDFIHSVTVSVFSNHIRWLQANSSEGLRSEFKSIGEEKNLTCADALTHSNITKNRYLNFSYDHSRVKLQFNGVDGSDYINASWVDGSRRNKAYIAAQGPLEETIGDMWRMIWENRVTAVAMLTDIIEGGRQKCVEYWPMCPGSCVECEAYDGCSISVKLVQREFYGHWIQTTLCLEHKSDDSITSRTVEHYQYTSWPDHGAPSSPSPLLGFLRHIRRNQKPSEKSENGKTENGGADNLPPPLLVHCSAGVGRTGTFIALDSLLEEVEEGQEKVNVFETVRRMRRSRPNMVLNVVQYMFLHSALLQSMSCGPDCREICCQLPEPVPYSDDELYDDAFESFDLETSIPQTA